MPLDHQGPGSHDKGPVGAGKRGAKRLNGQAIRLSGGRIVREVVNERGMNYAIRRSGSRSQAFVSAYIGDGLNRWPAVHRLDAAHLYRLVLEKGSGGAAYHGVADEGVPAREIAEVIGRRLNLPVVSKSREEAAQHFGWIAPFFAMDGPASSAKTRKLLGWDPKQPGLLADLDDTHYFAAAGLSRSAR